MERKILKKKSEELTAEETRKRRERIIIVISVVAIVCLTVFGTYITNRDLDIGVNENFILIALIDINIILLILVIFLVLRNFVKLIFERKRKVEAAKLRTKLVLSFAGLTLFPTVVMFISAMLFFSTSMDLFFNVQVENSLEGALDIAQTYYTGATETILTYAKVIGSEASAAKMLTEESRPRLQKFIDTQRDIRGVDLIKIFSPSMEELASSASEDIPDMSLIRLKADLFTEALSGKAVSTIQTTGYGDVVWALFPVMDQNEVVCLVMTADFIPKSLLSRMLVIGDFLEGYKKNKILKEPIVLSYLITLAIIALLLVFTATWLGFYLAKGITVPISLLAEGTKKVADGNLDVYVDVSTDDEVGVLVDSFNKMTQDLKMQSRRLERAYNELSRSNLEIEARRRYMEIVLKNVAAGVISVDKDGIITTINKSAERMLAIKTAKVLDHPFEEVLREKHSFIVGGLIEDLIASKDGFIQRQVEVPLEDRTLVLMANFNYLVDEEGNYLGMVAVFDDITEIMRAQKMAAWREVARRIAHEIKNPLTPIKLSAQRIRKKYMDRLSDDGQVLDECTRTIITQVEEMKALVDAFSQFARMPATRPRPNDLNDIVKETLALYKQAHKNIAYSFLEDERLSPFDLDREQIKRVLINLLENAVEAIGESGSVRIETSFMAEQKKARLVIADTGRGVTPEAKDRIFEPYYSTKKGGTGLGLTIVTTIISDHHGDIRVFNNEPMGTKFVIDLPMGTQ
ncbi:MAG: HAMP domain-containing protein [Deltaproteobacteria bacterium]|nr:HAMP domain-containing protein [Candidatus Zymogenaceae bacterium]